MTLTAPAIRVTEVTKTYGDQVVLDGFDLVVPDGTVFALLGPNGAGKTTLIRILATLAAPDAGRATVAGHDVTTAPHLVRRAISVTGQFSAVDEVLTGMENLVMVARLAGYRRAEAAERAAELLDTLDLTAAGDKRVATYSGGMRRRLDLAASLVDDPAVLFLDEPTTGLDTRSRQTLWELVGDLRRRGTTVLLTTQYLDEADHLADRIGVLDGGRLVAEGTGSELKARVGAEVVLLTFATDAEASRAAAVAAAGLGADTAAGGPDAGEPRVGVDDATARPGGPDGPDAGRGGWDGRDGPRVVRLPTDGSAADLRRILGRLAAHGLDAIRVDLQRPSLDDVFLSLTGPARGEHRRAPGRRARNDRDRTPEATAR